MKQQLLLRIGLPPGRRIYPSQFREMLAKLPNLPNELFHRDMAGQTINALPGIRMVGATGWVGLLAEPGSEQLLYDAMGSAVQAASSVVGQSCPVHVEKLQLGINAQHEAQIYWVREMAIKRKGPRSMTQDIQSLIQERVLWSIEASCDRHGFVCPTAEELEVDVIEVVHERGLRLQTTAGVTNQFVHLVDARVMINAKLEGMWFVGNLTSRGYGRIIEPRPGMRMESPRSTEILR